MAIRAAANQSDLVQRFGRVQSLEFDPSIHEIRASVLLKGESEPIQASARYVVEISGAESALVISDVKVSRPWLQEIVSLALQKGVPFRLPLSGTQGKLLSMIL